MDPLNILIPLDELVNSNKQGIVPIVRGRVIKGRLKWLFEIDGRVYGNDSKPRAFVTLTAVQKFAHEHGFSSFTLDTGQDGLEMLKTQERRDKKIEAMFRARGSMRDFADKYKADYTHLLAVVNRNVRYPDVRRAIAEELGVPVTELWPEEEFQEDT